MSVSAEHLSRSRLIADRYRIDGVLAEGGMAIVYGGWHVLLDQAIAVKVLREEYANNREAVARFLQEARVIAQLQGKHVPHVFDIGRIDDGAPFMVTELLEGSDLGRLLRAEGAFSVERALDVMISVCEAVEEAHRHGVVHRDLKPDNLFLARDADGDVCVKVLDFGVAKRLGARTRLTESEHGVGSPHYMSPEQILPSQEADFRSDVWSLGVVLYELLTGDTPYNGLTIPNVCASILNEDVPRPSKLREVPTAVERIIMTCLRKPPEQRYSNVRELRGALELVRLERPRRPSAPRTYLPRARARRSSEHGGSGLLSALPLLIPTAGGVLLLALVTPGWDPLQQVSEIHAAAPAGDWSQPREPQVIRVETQRAGSDVVHVAPVTLPTPMSAELVQTSVRAPRAVSAGPPPRARSESRPAEPARATQVRHRFAFGHWEPWQDRQGEIADPVEPEMGHDLIDPYPDLR